jgi:hypothetical protein
MKLLLKNNIAILLLADDAVVEIAANGVSIKQIEKGPEGNLNIEKKSFMSQLDSSNASVIENVIAPENFIAGKFKYEKNKFTVVNGWKDPEVA